jgi:hypothetical protein
MTLLSPFYPQKNAFERASITYAIGLPSAFHPFRSAFFHPPTPLGAMEAPSRAHSTRLPTPAALTLRSWSKPFDRTLP